MQSNFTGTSPAAAETTVRIGVPTASRPVIADPMLGLPAAYPTSTSVCLATDEMRFLPHKSSASTHSVTARSLLTVARW
jgi:hypothetical protein